MSDREQEYRILGLENNASLEEIEEAYQDLKSVWHPDRFLDTPKLRLKAEQKRQAVERAYQILRDAHVGERPVVVDPSTLKGRRLERGPSILDDTLSERIGKSKQRLPIWIALFGLVAVAVVISFLTWSPVDVESKPEPSPTEKILNDIRSGGYGDHEVPVTDQSAESVATGPEEFPVPSQPTPPPQTRPQPPTKQRTVSPATPPARSEITGPPSRPPLERKPVAAKPAPEAAEIVRDEVTSESGAIEESSAVSELAERSFQILRAKSGLANQLVEGSLGEFSFKDWKAVERSATEVYVDLVAEVVSEGREVHFVWAVDVEAQSVKAMSQAARDLQARER